MIRFIDIINIDTNFTFFGTFFLELRTLAGIVMALGLDIGWH
jgi:hypothetical protein